MDSSNNQDSPLSTSANVIGILTFVVAIAAAAYARIAFLRNSDDEYFRVKTSLSWYKTESTWLAELLRAMDDAQEEDEKKALGKRNGHRQRQRQQQQQQMYKFVMDDLLNLEQRLLDLVTDIEVKSALRGASEWTLLPRRWAAGRARPSVAVSWLGVRTKALELVRQREALTARVQFLQVSMISARMGDLEARVRVFEEKRDAGLVRADEDEETTEEWQSDYGE